MVVDAGGVAVGVKSAGLATKSVVLVGTVAVAVAAVYDIVVVVAVAVAVVVDADVAVDDIVVVAAVAMMVVEEDIAAVLDDAVAVAVAVAVLDAVAVVVGAMVACRASDGQATPGQVVWRMGVLQGLAPHTIDPLQQYQTARRLL